ncbi:syntenin-1-like [Centruroides vittatus]|uniref:syntenin-1-like n=1 Tax=Centruroides vittatus TaxID=120091 RepID=UPI00350EB2F5
MPLYPSLEDMKVDQMARAQHQMSQPHVAPPPPYNASVPTSASAPDLPYPIQPASAADAEKLKSLYPNLDEYMGLSLSREVVSAHLPNVVATYPASQVAIPAPSFHQMIAPLSGDSVGLKRAQVTHGIREITICKDGNGKVGMRVQPIDKGVFVSLVQANSPAALGGLRFGDQILQINGVLVAGFSMDKVHDLIKKASPQSISMAVRDRPFERTITLHKDSVGHCGFVFKNGKITAIVKDSSAARNGLLIDHHLLEVNGQNVVGLKDKEITQIIDAGGNVITITIMPSFVYEHIIKRMGSGLKNKMDHSVSDI